MLEGLSSCHKKQAVAHGEALHIQFKLCHFWHIPSDSVQTIELKWRWHSAGHFPGLKYVTNSFYKRCRWQMRPCNWVRAHISQVPGRASLEMPICSIRFYWLVKEEESYYARPHVFYNGLTHSMCAIIRQRRANDSAALLRDRKKPHWCGRRKGISSRCVCSRLCFSVSRVRVEGFFLHLLPMDQKNLKQQYGSISAAIAPTILQSHVRRN